MSRKSDKMLTALLGLLLTYYMITNLFSNAIDVFFPNLSEYVANQFTFLAGLIALSFCVATFILAVKEKNKGILLLFALFFVIIILSMVINNAIP